MKICFVTSDCSRADDGYLAPGGTAWLRAMLPARELAAHGHQTVVTDRFAIHPNTGELLPVIPPTLDTIDNGYDIIVFVRVARTDVHTAIACARSYGQLIVQDLDDWVWGIPTQNQAHAGWTPEILRAYGAQLRHCDLLTTSTPWLADRLEEKFRREAVVVRNAVDVAAYPDPDPIEGPARTVGWAGATGYRGGDLEQLRGILRPVIDRHGLTFVHVGHKEGERWAAKVLGLSPRTLTEWRPIVPAHIYPTMLGGIDIGIVPLAEIPFNRAKSDVKGLEYAAAGIPHVATRWGEYERPAGGGLSARRARDWLRHLERLVLDPEARAELRAHQYGTVRARDIATRWVDWANAYQMALGDREIAASCSG